MTTATISELASAIGCRPGEIATAEQAASSHATSYGAETVVVRLTSGDEVRLFVKHLAGSRLAKDDLAGRRARELHVYRDILAGAQLGTPRLHGIAADPSGDGCRLLLELVDGVELRYCAVDAWIDAAGWLPGLQAHGLAIADRLLSSPALLRHDEAFFHARTREAACSIERAFPDLAAPLRPALAAHDANAVRMSAGPRTLVHGAFQPRNVLVVEQPGGTRRVCPVDWELAAVGHPLFDLAFLVDGFTGEDLRRLVARYRAAAHDAGVPVSADLETVIDCFRLHRALTWIAHADARGYPRRVAEGLVDGAVALASSIGAPA